jgi:hypothetical protein
MLPVWYVVIYALLDFPGHNTLPDGTTRTVNYTPEKFGCSGWQEGTDGVPFAEIRWTRGVYDSVRVAEIAFFKSLEEAQRFHDFQYSQDTKGRATARLVKVSALTKTLAASKVGQMFMVPTGEVPVGWSWEGKPPPGWQRKR